MRKYLSCFVLTLIILISASAYAVPCVVTESIGEIAGTLKNRVDILNSGAGACDMDTVTFGVSTAMVNDGTLILATNSKSVIDGGDGVTVQGNVGGSVGVISVNYGPNNDCVIKNIIINNSNSGGYAVFLSNKQSTVQNSTLIAQDKVLGLVFGDNLLMSNNYKFQGTFDISQALKITTPALSAPDDINDITARLAADALTWILSGTVDAGANKIELYHVDRNAKEINFIGGGSVVGGAFELSIDVEQYNPEDEYALLVMNTTPGSLKTSAFSGAFSPSLDDAGFYSNVPACESATWLFSSSVKAWTNDSDGDGLTNGEEDSNKNCIIDSGETDPSSNDTDNDGVLDGSDTCPLVANADQADEDSDGVGDACPEASSAVSGAASSGGCNLVGSAPASLTNIIMILISFLGLTCLRSSRR